MNRDLYAADAVGNRVHWLLTLTWAGHTIRIADDELEIETDTDSDEWLHYLPGLGDLEVEEEITLGGDSSGTLTVPVEVVFPDDVDVPVLVARGHRLSAMRGELARWVEGTTFADRRVVLVGRAAQPTHGAAEEPVRFSLEESLAADVSRFGAPGLRVIGANWPEVDTIPTAMLGEDYPTIFGRPGSVSSSIASASWVTGSSATWIDYRRTVHDSGGGPTGNLTEIRALIAGHHVQVESVWVNTDDDPDGNRIRVANGVDDQGHPVAFLCWFYSSAAAGAPEDDYDEATYNYTFSGGSTVYGLGSNSLPTSFNDSAGGHRLYIGWRDEDDTTAGGLTVNGKLVRDAPDVLSYCLGLTSRTVDRGMMSSVGPTFSRFKIDGVIDRRIPVWEFLRDDLLPLLPVSLASGPNGLYVLPWRFEATKADATVFIDTGVDPEIERVSDIEEEDSEQVNRITIRYAYSYRTKTFLGEITLGAKEDEAEAENPENFRVNAYCQASRDQIGEIRERVIETEFVYDDSTAWAIAEWIAAAYAIPGRRVTWRVPEEPFVGARRAAVALLTDEETALDEEVALVTGIVTDGSGSLRITTRILDRPGKLYRGS